MQRLAAFKLSKVADKVCLLARRQYVHLLSLLPSLYFLLLLYIFKHSCYVCELGLQEEAYRRLLCHWLVPNTNQGPSASPVQGLMTPVSMVEYQPLTACTAITFWSFHHEQVVFA